MPTELEIHIADRKTSEIKVEFAGKSGAVQFKIEPRYLEKLQLALAASPAVLATRQDYRMALEMHRQAEGVRA